MVSEGGGKGLCKVQERASRRVNRMESGSVWSRQSGWGGGTKDRRGGSSGGCALMEPHMDRRWP